MKIELKLDTEGLGEATAAAIAARARAARVRVRAFLAAAFLPFLIWLALALPGILWQLAGGAPFHGRY